MATKKVAKTEKNSAILDKSKNWEDPVSTENLSAAEIRPPREYIAEFPEAKVASLSTVAAANKTLTNTDIADVRKNVSDVVVLGNGDMFRLLCKAASQEQGWMKSTKAMEIPGCGCVIQATTQQVNADGSNAVAEALVFVPGVKVVDDVNGGRMLVSTVAARPV
jgi:hypothetical protein